jgi:outer membrane autotransporter protein
MNEVGSTMRLRCGRASAVRGLLRGAATAAIGTGLFAGAVPALAAGECGAIVAGAVTCTAAGNPYATGVTYVSGESVALDTTADAVIGGPLSVAAGAGTVSIINRGTVTSAVADQAGVQALGNDSVSISGRGAVTTTGARAQGVRAVSGFTTGDATIDVGTVDVRSGGAAGLFAFSQQGIASATGTTINVSGEQGPAIVAQGTFGSRVGLGAVTTTGALSPGVLAEAPFGNVIVNGGSIATTGASSPGVIARSTGDISVTTSGLVNTDGALSQGIYALTTGGEATVDAAHVRTGGEGSAGVFASGVSATINSTGTIATTGGTVGGEATAAHAIATTGTAAINVRNVSTVADATPAAFAQSDRGNAAVTLTGNATTTGAGSNALAAEAFSGTAMVTNNGTVTTAGAGSQAIRAIGGLGATVAGTGSVATSGAGADGIFATSIGGPVSVTSGAVTTRGDGSVGIAAGSAGPVSVRVAGPVSTSGAGGMGVYAVSSGNAATISAIDVTTTGAGSAGLLANGVSAAITSTGTVTTSGAGVESSAVHAVGTTGLAQASVRNVRTSGENAVGALAESNGGNAAVTLAGTATTSGAAAYALSAQDFLGSATVTNNGVVVTSGLAAEGVRAVGGRGATVTGTGTVATSGDNAPGVFAASIFAPANVTTGAVVTTGRNSTGIVAGATQSSASVNATSVRTSGAGATGILLVADTGASVTSTMISTSGAASRGIDVASRAGPIVINSGAVTTTGADSAGIVAVGNGAIVVNSGSATVRSGTAIFLQSNASTAALTVTGTTSADRDVVSVNAAGNGLLTIASTGSIIGATNAAVVSGSSTTIANAGRLTGGSGYALAAFGGPATFTNTGTTTGRILLTGGADRVTNSGTFNAAGDSDFGAGNDLLTNSGTFNAATGTSPATVRLIGLESFANQGSVTLANGVVGDRLVLGGGFVGSGGSTLALDATFAPTAITADQLVLSGAATGSTTVTLVPTGSPNLQLIVPNGPVLVQGGAGSVAGAFNLDPAQASNGFAQYGIVFNPTANSYSLIAAPSAAARRQVKFVEGARNIWYRTSDAWSAHVEQLRDAQANGVSPGSKLWGQVYGGGILRRGRADYTFGGQTVAAGQSYSQDQFGGQLGYDLQSGGPDSAVAFGVTGGYSSSDMNFRTGSGRGRFDTVNGGAYLTARAGPLFVSLLGQYDYHWLRIGDAALGLSRKLKGQSYGATGEVGMRFGSAGFFVEPIATLSYVRTDLDSWEAFSSRFDFRTGEGLRGTAGARIGTTFDRADGSHVLLYVGGHAVKEFEGKDSLVFSNNGTDYRFGSDNIGLYGEGVAGVKVISAGRLSGFIEGFGDYGRRSDSVRGGGGRVGLSIAL